MKALITGASSGIGKDIAIELAKKGIDLILVARDIKKLEEVKKEINKSNKINIKVVSLDISVEKNCIKLYEENKDIEILVNNAGFGDCGNFTKTSLEKEMRMIQTNINAYHILTKLYLINMKKECKGKILNVASIAGFLPGPLMATYYATKAYVVSLSESIREELKQEKSNVKISILCPGPVETNFTKVANVRFNMKSASSKEVAKYAVDKLFKGKFYIVPRIEIRIMKNLAKLAPRVLVGKIMYKIQKHKLK